MFLTERESLKQTLCNRLQSNCTGTPLGISLMEFQRGFLCRRAMQAIPGIKFVKWCCGVIFHHNIMGLIGFEFTADRYCSFFRVISVHGVVELADTL